MLAIPMNPPDPGDLPRTRSDGARPVSRTPRARGQRDHAGAKSRALVTGWPSALLSAHGMAAIAGVRDWSPAP